MQSPRSVTARQTHRQPLDYATKQLRFVLIAFDTPRFRIRCQLAQYFRENIGSVGVFASEMIKNVMYYVVLWLRSLLPANRPSYIKYSFDSMLLYSSRLYCPIKG